MTKIFYSCDCSIFQYQTMYKSSIELGLVYKTFVNKHTCETPLLTRKNKLYHVTLCYLGNLNKVIFPLQPKTHFFRDSAAETQMKCIDGRALALALVDACEGAFFQEKCPYKGVPQSFTSARAMIEKSFPKLVRTQKEDFYHRNTQSYFQIVFLKLWPCLV